MSNVTCDYRAMVRTKGFFNNDWYMVYFSHRGYTKRDVKEHFNLLGFDVKVVFTEEEFQALGEDDNG